MDTVSQHWLADSDTRLWSALSLSVSVSVFTVLMTTCFMSQCLSVDVSRLLSRRIVSSH